MAIFGGLVSGLGTLARQAIPMLGGAAVAGIASRLGPRPAAPRQMALPGIGAVATRAPTTIAMRRMLGPAAVGIGSSLVAGRVGQMFAAAPRRRRRMNVTNVRALRRSLRRVEGFEKVCKRVLTVTTGRTPKTKFKRRRRC